LVGIPGVLAFVGVAGIPVFEPTKFFDLELTIPPGRYSLEVGGARYEVTVPDDQLEAEIGQRYNVVAIYPRYSLEVS
jgi:hypothetical protein